MSWEKQRKPRRVGQTVQLSGVRSPEAWCFALRFAGLPCSELLLNQTGANHDLGGLPTEPRHVTRRKKVYTLDLKTAWQDQNADHSQGPSGIHKTWSCPQDLVWNNIRRAVLQHVPPGRSIIAHCLEVQSRYVCTRTTSPKLRRPWVLVFLWIGYRSGSGKGVEVGGGLGARILAKLCEDPQPWKSLWSFIALSFTPAPHTTRGWHCCPHPTFSQEEKHVRWRDRISQLPLKSIVYQGANVARWSQTWQRDAD